MENIDLSQFFGIFFEEAEEHLENMESLLLNLDLVAPDSEDLNAIFRAAHSIKGGSGTFGFTDMADLTHEAETLLDRVRKSELVLTRAMVDCLLSSKDVLTEMIAAHRANEVLEHPQVMSLVLDLRHLATTEHKKIVVGVRADDTLHKTIAHAPEAFNTGMDYGKMPDSKRWLLTFGPISTDIHQVALDSVFADFAMIGYMEEVQRGGHDQPYILYITTIADADEMIDLLQFVVDKSHVSIKQAEVINDDLIVNSAKTTDDDFGFFDDEPAAKPDAYGLFTEEPQAASLAYGFYDDEKSASSVVDESFGFFEPINPVIIGTSVVVTQATTKVSASQNDALSTTTIDKRTVSTSKKVEKTVASDTSIRVSVEKVDQLINLSGELVITQAVLLQKSEDLNLTQHQPLLAGLADLERNTRDLQEAVLSIRMLPISFVFNRFPRMLRDLAAKLNKEIELTVLGESTELDKGLIEKVADPMTHLVRNSLDHGIELPAVRLAKGKSAHGTITLSAFHKGGNVVIKVSDDGAGLRRDKIVAKARERGFKIADDASDSEVWNLIFEAGFSTAEAITEVSGRGVGMDVVKRNILEMGGTIELESVVDQGTSVTIRLPLTLAILDGMSVNIGEESYIIPLNAIVESILLKPKDIHSVSGHGAVIEVRSEYLPVMDLRILFSVESSSHLTAGDQLAVIVESDGIKTALLVDELNGQHQVVVKSLESNYRKLPNISGATIMGDGRVALILDISALVRMSRR